MTAYIGIVAAAVAAWIFGAAWYAILGRQWQAALGMKPDECKDRKMPLKPMIVSFLAELVMAGIMADVLAHASVVGWRWGLASGLELGVGFMAMTTVVNNVFPGRKAKLSVIDSGHWIGVAAIMGTILGAFA